MADKQKIRNYACELLKDSQNGFGSASYNMLKMVIAYIDSLPEEPVSEDLGEYINELSKQFPEVSFAKLSRIAVRVAKWKEQQLMANALDGVVHHFEKCKVACVYYNDPTGVPMAYFTSPEGLSAGDKVKIIVIKE